MAECSDKSLTAQEQIVPEIHNHGRCVVDFNGVTRPAPDSVLIEVMKYLKSSGVSVEGFSFHNGLECNSPEEILEYLKIGPDAYWPKFFGSSSEELQEWHDNTGYIRCSFIKKNGKRCGNLLQNGGLGQFFDIEEWLVANRSGLRCHCHREGGAK